jgi:predicted RNA-binding Zn-ribbon protein involved in translation (DUF1610 family)
LSIAQVKRAERARLRRRCRELPVHGTSHRRLHDRKLGVEQLDETAIRPHIRTIIRDVTPYLNTPLFQYHRRRLRLTACSDVMLRPCAGAVMEHLVFLCPATRQEVHSGIESEIGTLLRIRERHVRLLCPACGAWHVWPVRDAFLAKYVRHALATDPHIA